jgi:hypothetical protein
VARLTSRLSYANVVATIALFVALGGSGYAAVTLSKNSVTSKSIKNGQVKTADLAKNAVTSAKIKDFSLLPKDFKSGVLGDAATMPMARILFPATAIFPSTLITLEGTTEVADTANMHSDTTNPSRITAPVAGTYIISASVRWNSAAGDHLLDIEKNATTFLAGNVAGATAFFPPINSVTTVAQLAAGDYVEAVVEASQNTSTSTSGEVSNLSMAFTGP